MRVLIATTTRRIVGGAERYVEAAIAALTEAGHDVALLTEFEGPASRPLPEAPALAHSWTLHHQPNAYAEVARWRPDVVFSQGLSSPAHERELLRIAPTVLVAHGYRGQCISGSKTLRRRNRVCTRRLGPTCLLHYFPDGCGGRSPISMLASWQRERAHGRLFAAYAAVITLSEHMRRSCIAHGVKPQAAVAIPPARPRADMQAGASATPPPDLAGGWRLLFVGRLEPLKGGDLLIDAAADLAARRTRPVHLALVGEGAMRESWRSRADRAQRSSPALTVTFEGWLEPHQQQQWFAWAHLLVVPSVWPEPYGLVGIEAARHGVPAVAFPVGGIPEWLIDGVTGRLAALPASVGSLASAIGDVLDNTESYRRMRQHTAWAWHADAAPHFECVIAVLERAASSHPLRERRGGMAAV